MTAILFGSISTIADTSELQREAFNRAFVEHGLDWSWSREEYQSLLSASGGRDRVADYGASRGEDEVDAEAVHRTKSELFQRRLAEGGIPVREGVVDTIREARAHGLRVAFVTTTSPENVAALAGAVSHELSFDDAFDLLVDSSQVHDSKPSPAAYEYALQALGEQPGQAVAIEDNPGGVESAHSAGVTTVAFPNANTAALDFPHATTRRDRLDLGHLHGLLAG